MTSRRRARLVTGLMLAQGAVLAVAVLVAVVVAAAVGPPLFHEHMIRAGAGSSSDTLAHVEEAFRSAGLITLAAAFGVALLLAATVTFVLGRRLTRPLDALARAADQVAAGRHDVQVRLVKAPVELATVTDAFNQMARDLDQTEQVRARLLSDLAHEVRTPLTTLTTYLDALDDGVAEPSPQTLSVLREQVDRLTRLAQDMGAVSRAEEAAVSLRAEPVSVQDLVESVVAPLRPHLPGSLVLEVDIPDAAAVRGDRARLQQVLTNLLDNACRHTPAGRVSVVAVVQERSVEIRVADTGDGVPAEALPHLFERFYRADTARDRDHGGSGLGLAICRAVVHAHDGTVTASSAGPGQGATFTVTLPKAS